MEPLSPADRLTDAAVGQAVTDVLGRPPFTDRFDPHGFGEIARSWQNGVTGSLSLGDGALLVVLVLVLAGIAGLVGWAVRALVRRKLEQRLAVAGGEASTAAVPAGFAELGAAEAAVSRGEHRVAVELAWRAANLGLGGAGALTPRQWARWAAHRLEPDRRRDLTRLLTLHEACCYAGRLATRRAAVAAGELARRLGTA